jgi:hypothetical protein
VSTLHRADARSGTQPSVLNFIRQHESVFKMRFVVGGRPKIIEKMSHNLAATLDFLLVGGSFGLEIFSSTATVPAHVI